MKSTRSATRPKNTLRTRSSGRVGSATIALGSAPMAWKGTRAPSSPAGDHTLQPSGDTGPGTASDRLTVLHEASGAEVPWIGFGVVTTIAAS